jgi:hypothetical protein
MTKWYVRECVWDGREDVVLEATEHQSEQAPRRDITVRRAALRPADPKWYYMTLEKPEGLTRTKPA